MRVERIPFDLIIPFPFNVQQNVDVDSLAQSIAQMGQIEFLRVRPIDDKYEVRTGRRRFLALKAAGATHADAIVGGRFRGLMDEREVYGR